MKNLVLLLNTLGLVIFVGCSKQQYTSGSISKLEGISVLGATDQNKTTTSAISSKESGDVAKASAEGAGGASGDVASGASGEAAGGTAGNVAGVSAGSATSNSAGSATSGSSTVSKTKTCVSTDDDDDDSTGENDMDSDSDDDGCSED